jgi:hypothetical protein
MNTISNIENLLNSKKTEVSKEAQFLMGGAYAEDMSIDLDNFSIEEEIKKFADVDMRGYRLLIRSYITPAKTKSGLFLGQKAIDEQIYTCTTGLVVRKSKEAYDDPRFRKGHWCQVGEWIAFDKTRANLHYILGLPCWALQEEGVEFAVPDPRMTTKR